MTTIPLPGAGSFRFHDSLRDRLPTLLAVMALSFLVGVATAVSTPGALVPIAQAGQTLAPSARAQIAPLAPGTPKTPPKRPGHT